MERGVDPRQDLVPPNEVRTVHRPNVRRRERHRMAVVGWGSGGREEGGTELYSFSHPGDHALKI